MSSMKTSSSAASANPYFLSAFVSAPSKCEFSFCRKGLSGELEFEVDDPEKRSGLRRKDRARTKG
jgi:hypothetical protein